MSRKTDLQKRFPNGVPEDINTELGISSVVWRRLVEHVNHGRGFTEIAQRDSVSPVAVRSACYSAVKQYDYRSRYGNVPGMIAAALRRRGIDDPSKTAFMSDAEILEMREVGSKGLAQIRRLYPRSYEAEQRDNHHARAASVKRVVSVLQKEADKIAVPPLAFLEMIRCELSGQSPASES